MSCDLKELEDRVEFLQLILGEEPAYPLAQIKNINLTDQAQAFVANLQKEEVRVEALHFERTNSSLL